MSDITVTTSGGRVTAHCPHNTDLIEGARQLGGRFDRAAKAWTFDARDETRVRGLLIEVFGTDGAPTATVDVRVALDAYPWQNSPDAGGRSRVTFAGRAVAERPGRDMPVRLSGAVVVEGGFPRGGGSVRYPDLDPRPGTALEVRDVPVGHPDVQAPGVVVVRPAVVEIERED